MWQSTQLAFRIAYRSFLRHGRRSVIAGSAVALSLAMMIFFQGIGDDSHARMIEMGVRMGSGHVIVENRDYEIEQSASAVVGDLDLLLKKARAISRVSFVAPRITTSGLITHGGKSSSVLLNGGDPSIEPEASDIASAKNRKSGAYVRPRSEREFLLTPGDIYLGDSLAKKLDARLDDRVVVTIAPPGGGDPRAAAFVVRGTFHTGVREVDSSVVQVDLDDARSLLQVGAVATQVALILQDQDEVAKVTSELSSALASRSEVVIRPWQDVLKELHDAVVLDAASGNMLMGVIFIIVTLGIFNTILMSVTERTRELGVQKALGTSAVRIFSYVLLEAGILAVVAALVGLGLGLSVHLVIAHYGINIESLLGEDYEISGIAFSGYIYSRLTLGGVVTWTMTTISLVLLSAIYPAYRASRMIPVEAMRHV